MKKFIIYSILLFINLSVFAKDYSKLYKKLDKSIVIIYSNTKQVRSKNDELVSFTSSSLGTGTLINSEGLILTAAHVVNSADELTVDVQGKGQFKAKVLSSYQAADIALIKLITNDKDFPAIKIANSEKTQIGEEVFVIGTPYGLSHTLTVGHLSGRRIHEGLGKGEIEFLQTDAAINQGNSGGPLFNSKGQLIGVVSYIETQSGGNEGLGFAASSNMVKRILIEQPTIWFGMEFSLLSYPVAKALNVPQKSGILVEKVAKQSFADKIGLKGGVLEAEIEGLVMLLGGDILLAVGDIIITGESGNYMNIADYLKNIKSGEQIMFKLLRNGHIIELSAAKPSIKIKLI
ncbi:S1C family serine protease [Pseudoalteromonas denitrificans]|jgi:serine protease Do|uniref:Serine protease Do n=1 Tax=Pseudoalteromonas denitrificans DSM 6059 TaxID=1123010 RepID=A0A1I1GTV2_9GAMM|nr:trypsin-like peptidase domain-containing protein [Pseudoalteromonas denitrificans]SFC14916.1 serine protease Do [Pseudoalteromonas denitrificans DSM 6059]